MIRSNEQTIAAIAEAVAYETSERVITSVAAAARASAKTLTHLNGQEALELFATSLEVINQLAAAKPKASA